MSDEHPDLAETIKNYRCRKCPSLTFEKRGDYERHNREVHNKAPLCPVCQIDLDRKDVLREHLKSMHRYSDAQACEVAGIIRRK